MTTLRRTTLIPAATLAGLLALGACGTTDTGSGGGEETAAASSEAAAGGAECADSPTTDGAVEVTDDLGRTVSLDGPATKVVALEWQQVEDVATLCVDPVAVADVKGFETWTAVDLADSVKDAGQRGEPNLDAIFATDPDLVIIEASSKDDDVLKKLEEYDVPVLATTGADSKDSIGKMKDTFNLIAETLGKQERAAQVIEEFDTALEEGKAAMDEAAPAQREFIYFDGWMDGGNVAVRPFGKGSLVGDLGEALGLKNAWTGEVDPAYGLGQTDIEGLTAVGDATLLHTGTSDAESDIVPAMESNSVWKDLPAVKEDRVHAFPEGIWTFGGPKSSMQIIDAYVQIYTASE